MQKKFQLRDIKKKNYIEIPSYENLEVTTPRHHVLNRIKRITNFKQSCEIFRISRINHHHQALAMHYTSNPLIPIISFYFACVTHARYYRNLH